MEGDLNGDRRSDPTVSRPIDMDRPETERSGTRRQIERFPWNDRDKDRGQDDKYNDLRDAIWDKNLGPGDAI